MKAKLLFREKNTQDDGSILELVLWKLPQKTADRPHGLKYRLYYGDNKNNCLVRYDNENGKGDHKHIDDREIPYRFVDCATLMKDFYKDIQISLQKRRRR